MPLQHTFAILPIAQLFVLGILSHLIQNVAEDLQGEAFGVDHDGRRARLPREAAHFAEDFPFVDGRLTRLVVDVGRAIVGDDRRPRGPAALLPPRQSVRQVLAPRT